MNRGCDSKSQIRSSCFPIKSFSATYFSSCPVTPSSAACSLATAAPTC
jgi:hypothetical protein